MAKTASKRWPIPDLPYGLVLITRGRHAGRIGDYDDDGDNPFQGVVYFGGMLRARGYHLVDKRYMKEPTVSDLYRRYTDISNEILDILKADESPMENEYRYLCSIMAEAHQIYTEMEWRNVKGRYGTTRNGKRIYLAHSSKDKGVARMVHDDLKHLGHNPWLDEYKISVGESIIRKLEQGISECEYMMVFLSKNAENSEWVRVEWETKFWSEIERQRISVLPALIEDCVIPPMLARRKYADFRDSYNEGLDQILLAIGHRQKRTTNKLFSKRPKSDNSL
jgi:hypothetical protein